MYVAIIFLLLYVSSLVETEKKPYQVTTVSIAPKSKFFNTKEKTIRYPIFHFPDKEITKKVNRVLRFDFLETMVPPGSDTGYTTIKRLLHISAESGLTDLSLDSVTFISDKLISFHIGVGWLAAYPSFFSEYFVFDLREGRRLAVTDLIKPERLSTFHSMIEQKQKAMIKSFHDSSVVRLARKEFEIEDYEYILEATKEHCLDNFNPLRYILHRDSIEIVVVCPFAHWALPLEQYNNIFLSRTELAGFLREYLF